ncbi:6-hydroxymethylpterin diphosphokinase MptE-like protein [Bowmanella sp. JS7-9]|uniref:motility associated factor glycosyltransferase family protein n=1 Tax=Alteromonadaceae TaxID=72275 RepID=UPI00103EB330|nr:6-hydroxymethylpterin diphosphokinase MptE-like protein [Bowmanella sp. JS7-9]
MLKDIRLHLHQDEDAQTALEDLQADFIAAQFQQNMRALRAHMPSVAAELEQVRSQNISIFCNKSGGHNIVDYGTGRVLYGLEPQQEITTHLQHWQQHPLFIDLANQHPLHHSTDDVATRAAAIAKRSPLPEEVDTLVVFGLGLGQHLATLLQQHRIRHLVVYEPELQYLHSSSLVGDWQQILDLAQQKNTLLFMLSGKDGRDLVENMQELQQHAGIAGFYLYKHYHHPVFDGIEQDLMLRSWPQIAAQGLRLKRDDFAAYKPLFCALAEPEQLAVCKSEHHPRFQQNMAAFSHYFPDIAAQFRDYTPRYWWPVAAGDEVNLLDLSDLALLYSKSPAEDGRLNSDNFVNHPNKDGLVLGYKGEKLKNYLHYQYVAKTESLMARLEEKRGTLPDTIKSLIMFGLGSGYQLQALLDGHRVEKLFICEPNRDFFYASLFAIDWAEILKQVDDNGWRIYLNVGDDGSNLFRDLLHQFYAIGPYNLANTYFYQSYHNPNLSDAVANLREQLQVVISMGEYFDHARYGIAHTTETLRRGYHLLTDRKTRPIPFELGEVPVFVVGNGPSLDASLDAIREYRDQAIVISCGTALMPLQKAGIVPDYHAEIEQNRSTFDWCSRVGDFEFLKQITLISCNGIHPDTCDLFKDVLIALKDGESSTVSATEVLGKGRFHELKFAFPTVSNLVVNLFCELGFTQLYLLGVDLGFVDDKHHHSKQSGYYDQQGEELYNYRERNHTALRVPGNFRPMVFTKHEFKVSKTIIEQALANHRQVECFNCSDGAKIAGATPLNLDFMLITSAAETKQQALHFLHEKAFTAVEDYSHYPARFDAHFRPDVLHTELNKLQQLVDATEATPESIDQLIEKQRILLFASYKTSKSLLFYLFYGSMNYTNAFLSKVLSVNQSEKEALGVALDMWKQALADIVGDYLQQPAKFDTVSSFSSARMSSWIKRVATSVCHLEVHGDTQLQSDWLQQIPAWRASAQDKANWRVLWLNRGDSQQETADYHLVILPHGDLSATGNIVSNSQLTIMLPGFHRLSLDTTDILNGIAPVWYSNLVINLCSSLRQANFSRGCIIAKVRFLANDSPHKPYEQYFSGLDAIGHYVDFGSYIWIPATAQVRPEQLIDGFGTRGRQVFHPPTPQDLVIVINQAGFSKMQQIAENGSRK